MHRRAGLFILLGVSTAGLAAHSIGPIALKQLPANSRLAALLPASAAIQAQPAYTPNYAPSPAYSPVASSIALWTSLRQSDSLPFSSYASFLARNRGWPGEDGMRRSAERRLAVEAVSPGEVTRYFAALPPLTATGHAQYAFALQASGQAEQARAEAKLAWIGGSLNPTEEQRIIAGFPGALVAADHDQRMDMLLSSGDTAGALRNLAWSSPARRSLYETRMALQSRAPDASTRLAALDAAARNDGGLILDQAIWLRATSQPAAARQMLANRPTLDRPIANPQRWLDTALTLARGAANDRNWQVAYGIASKVDDLYAPGTDVSTRPYDERDDYTSLVWLGGTTALQRLNRPADAARMFERYARAARSPQTRAKGFYWASRAAAASGQAAQASAWLEQAAGHPDQFYGQLALERLGRPAPAPAALAPSDAAERAALAARPLAEAVRYLGMVGRRADQTAFVRALAGQLTTDRERQAAGDFGRQIGRPDVGVWAAREARTTGGTFYARAAFPDLAIPPAYARNWAFAHGIIRQESSFERTAVSSAGARGLMQLMPGTARQTAGRAGVSYDLGRLTADPAYNVLLGNYFLSQLMDEWGGNAVLVAAAYNAGSGNVRRWIAANGDPRLPGADMVRWIEEIPISETRNYVQRVLENAVVYDMINPNGGAPSRNRLSNYLGQRSPG
jgi:soluble lytic murein transglycosylase